jgi:hypothetical protein
VDTSTAYAQLAKDQADLRQLDPSQTPSSEQLALIARLRMRYPDGPLRRQLDHLLDQWELPIDTLHGITRAYWAAYRHSGETVVDSGSGADVNT